MNYLWQLLLHAKESGIDADSIRFRVAKSYSPYMELAQNEINNIEITDGMVIELNPYYRYYSIFKDMYHEDMSEYRELRDAMFHLIIHFIAEEDLKQGMNRQEYYKAFLFECILDNDFGATAQKNIMLFNIKERNLILNGLIKLFATGHSLDLLKEMMTKLFSNTIIYSSRCHINEMLIYIGQKETKELEAKVELVLQLFAHAKSQIELYYHYHFAILGLEETMGIDEIALY